MNLTLLRVALAALFCLFFTVADGAENTCSLLPPYPPGYAPEDDVHPGTFGVSIVEECTRFLWKGGPEGGLLAGVGWSSILRIEQHKSIADAKAAADRAAVTSNYKPYQHPYAIGDIGWESLTDESIVARKKYTLRFVRGCFYAHTEIGTTTSWPKEPPPEQRIDALRTLAKQLDQNLIQNAGRCQAGGGTTSAASARPPGGAGTTTPTPANSAVTPDASAPVMGPGAFSGVPSPEPQTSGTPPAESDSAPSSEPGPITVLGESGATPAASAPDAGASAPGSDTTPIIPPLASGPSQPASSAPTIGPGAFSSGSSSSPAPSYSSSSSRGLPAPWTALAAALAGAALANVLGRVMGRSLAGQVPEAGNEGDATVLSDPGASTESAGQDDGTSAGDDLTPQNDTSPTAPSDSDDKKKDYFIAIAPRSIVLRGDGSDFATIKAAVSTTMGDEVTAESTFVFEKLGDAADEAATLSAAANGATLFARVLLTDTGREFSVRCKAMVPTATGPVTLVSDSVPVTVRPANPQFSLLMPADGGIGNGEGAVEMQTTLMVFDEPRTDYSVTFSCTPGLTSGSFKSGPARSTVLPIPKLVHGDKTYTVSAKGSYRIGIAEVPLQDTKSITFRSLAPEPDATPSNASGSQSAPEQGGGDQEKRDKLHDIIKTLAGIEDPDKRNQLIGIIKHAAQVDARGVPQGDLGQIAAMLHNQLNADQPPGALEEALRQTKDFAQGVGQDIHDLGTAGVETVKGAARDIKDLATDSDFSHDFWRGTHDTLSSGADAIGRGIQSSVQSAKDLGDDVKHLMTDTDFRKDFYDSVHQNVNQAADKIKDVANEAALIGSDVWKDPRILVDTFGRMLDDLHDPKKVEEAIRNGLPGGALLVDAMDKSKGIIERLKNGLLGASEWAGAAATLGDLGHALEGGTRLIGKTIGSGLAEAATDVGDGLAGRAMREAENLGSAAGVDAVAEDAGAAAVGVESEAGEGTNDLLKTRKPGAPESQALPPQGADARGTHVRNILREEGYREDLINRVDYEPMHASGSKQVLGSTRGMGEDAEAVIHDSAFDQGPTSLRSTTQHEVDHVLQQGQLETQAAPHGPKADWIDEHGQLTPKGKEMAEMEVRMQELDRNLTTRENAIRRAGANSADKTTWPQEALDADKEVAGARAWLENHNVGAGAAPGAPPAMEPPGDDLYKVGRQPQPDHFARGRTFEEGITEGENLNTLLKGNPDPALQGPEFLGGRPFEGLQHTSVGGFQGSEMPVIDKLVRDPARNVKTFASVADGTGRYMAEKFEALMNAAHPGDPELPHLASPEARTKMLDFLGYKDAPEAFLQKAELWVPSDKVPEAKAALQKVLDADPNLDRFAQFRDYMRQQGKSNSEIAHALLDKIKGK